MASHNGKNFWQLLYSYDLDSEMPLLAGKMRECRGLESLNPGEALAG